MNIAEKTVVAVASIYCCSYALREVANDFPVFYDEMVRLRRLMIAGSILFSVSFLFVIKHLGLLW